MPYAISFGSRRPCSIRYTPTVQPATPSCPLHGGGGLCGLLTNPSVQGECVILVITSDPVRN